MIVYEVDGILFKYKNHAELYAKLTHREVVGVGVHEDVKGVPMLEAKLDYLRNQKVEWDELYESFEEYFTTTEPTEKSEGVSVCHDSSCRPWDHAPHIHTKPKEGEEQS